MFYIRTMITIIVYCMVLIFEGCSQNSEMECDSNLNEELISSIIKKNEQYDFHPKLFDINNVKIDPNTGERECHASLILKVNDKEFMTEIDYNVVKLLKSKFSQKITIQNYSNISRLRSMQIEPYFQILEKTKIAKEKGFNTLEEYERYNHYLAVIEQFNLKTKMLTKLLKAREQSIFKNNNVVTVQDDIIKIIGVKYSDYFLELQIINTSKQPIEISSVELDLLVFSSKYKLQLEELLKTETLSRKLQPNESAWIMYKKIYLNKEKITDNGNKLLFSIRTMKINGKYYFIGGNLHSSKGDKQTKEIRQIVQAYSDQNLNKLTTDIKELSKQIKEFKQDKEYLEGLIKK